MLGKATAAGLHGLVQAIVVYLVAIALDVHIRWAPLPMLTVAAAVFLGSCVFATFSLVIACIVKSRERFFGIGQVVTMLLFFASNAIYPLELMLPRLKTAATFNPLTYLVDALRGAMIVEGQSVYPYATSFCVLLLAFALLLAVASRLYPGLARWPRGSRTYAKVDPFPSASSISRSCVDSMRIWQVPACRQELRRRHRVHAHGHVPVRGVHAQAHHVHLRCRRRVQVRFRLPDGEMRQRDLRLQHLPRQDRQRRRDRRGLRRLVHQEVRCRSEVQRAGGLRPDAVQQILQRQSGHLLEQRELTRRLGRLNT